MDVNHANSLAPRRDARQAGKPRENSIETDQEGKRAEQQHRVAEHAAKNLPFYNDVGVFSGVMLRWSRSRIGDRYALQRRTQIVASVTTRVIRVKQKRIEESVS